MGDTDDKIVLTDQEREALAGLAASIGDPWLAGQLAGPKEVDVRRERRPAGLRLPARLSSAPRWVGLVLLLAGTVLTLATFTVSIAVASLGLLAMGAGMWRLALEFVGPGRPRLKLAKTAPPPPPPTPPAAA